MTIRLKVYRNEIGPVKTLASNRTIAIPQILFDHLKVHRERMKGSDWVFTPGRTKNKHWDDRKYQQRWSKLRKRAGVRTLGTHAWRHFFISMALSQYGWTPAEVAKHCGTSVKMILERYAHAIRRNQRVDLSFVDDFGS